MKLRTAILLLSMLTGLAWAQNPDVIQDTRSTLQNVQKKQVIDQNAVLAAAGQASPGKTVNPAGPAVAAGTAKPAATATSASKPNSAHHGSAKSVKAAAHKSPKQATPVAVTKPEPAASTVAVEDKKNPPDPKKEPRTYAAEGRRDPFISPVVNRIVAEGCSTGKRCLAINQITLTGIVKSDGGMIAVVVNAMNKAYFLRENDPVFNGYVVRITGDSVVFQESVQDNLGKTLTREVTKRISVPAA